ncbi:MAG: oligoendopeptidase F [Peptostreptococcaceae bacterium]|nr:oligoendopeptidase F [Peptostreptococcaceae bacterium]
MEERTWNMSTALKKRSEISEDLKWDLTRLYGNEKEHDEAMGKAASAAKSISKKFKGKISTPEDVLNLLKEYSQLMIDSSHISNYSYLKLSVDMTDEESQKLSNRVDQLLAEIETEVKFVDSELMDLDEAVLNEAIDNTEEFKIYLQILKERKQHRLPAESEELLATLGPVLSLPFRGYETTKLSDIDFPDFEVRGKSYPLSYVLFENEYQYHVDTEVRRAAFEAFSKKIREYVNTTANYYTTQTQKEKILSRLRGFDSVMDYLLFEQRVSADLYNRQIDLITEHLAPHMRRYAKLLQKVHGIEKMTFADLKLPLDPDFSPTVTIEESKKYVQGALSVLGEEYIGLVMKSYEERWVDYAQNIGKSTGGFCSSPYRKNSYILLSWTGMLSEVFTLVHELGHAGHFALAQRENNILEEECSLYFIEAPSTANEMLLSNYLMKQSEDKRFCRWVLSSMIGNTYYHNFVTHLLEAAYQREVYRAVDRGESLQAGDYSRIKREVLEKFWGDAVEINEGAELTWMRQPHYYMGLYPYTYSAGLTVSTQISRRILEEGERAAQDWVKVLKAGGRKTPEELAKMAGVDISTDKPLMDTIAYIGDVITQMEELTDSL